jgi:ligand-binding SRPBCC domain-containing protein
MHFIIRSRIAEASVDAVFAGFDLALFTFLSPALPKMRVQRFDGCKTGDIVSVSLFVPGLPEQKWISEIIHHESVPGRFHEFIDEGKTLPFFLKKWKHVHRIEQAENDVLIVDDIHFKTSWYFPSLLAYTMLYPSFSARKKKYAAFFKRSIT